jgi:transcription initiation factor TFIIIB Brf1 subunit/transcription initiation factor TFIIB
MTGRKRFIMIISVKPCENCGASEVSDFREYDGCLGYEAIICKKCGYIYDHSGAHSPDEEENFSE